MRNTWKSDIRSVSLNRASCLEGRDYCSRRQACPITARFVRCGRVFPDAFVSILSIVLFVGILFGFAEIAHGTIWDCLWGGPNESTEYTRPYVAGMGGVTLTPAPSPGMNLGAPQPGIPVQATPNTQALTVPQATIPTITSPNGPVGTVGQPATLPQATQPQASPIQAPPGTEIVYVLPSQSPPQEECLDGVKRTPAIASTIVAAGTPGAIPVAVKTVSVIRPKKEYQWSFSPIRTKTETLVRVVDPRTGRVVKTYCKTDEDRSSLPLPHFKEVIKYETVQAKVGVPVNVAAAASGSTRTAIPGHTTGTSLHQTNYPLWNPSSVPVDGESRGTIILPQ